MQGLTICSSWVLPIYQQFFLDYDTRYYVLYGGAGSGKSYAITQKLIVQGLRQKHKILVIRKVGTSLRESVFSLFKEILGQFPESYITKITESDMKIVLVNGTEILFKSMDDPEKIKSINGVTICWMEESSELTEEDVSQLVLRLRTKGIRNQFIFSFNPISKQTYMYKRFFGKEKDTRDTKIIHSTYKDNPNLPKTYIEDLKAMEQTNPLYYKIYALGEFGSLGKLIYPTFKIEQNTPEYVGKKGYWWVGCDLGYNDPTAVTYGYYLPEEKELWITGEIYGTEMSLEELVGKIRDHCLQKSTIVFDSAEPRTIEYMKARGIHKATASIKGPDSVRVGIDRVRENKIFVMENCIHTITALNNYEYKKDKKTGEYIDEPVHDYSHIPDSIRYGIQSVINKKHDKDYEDNSLWLY